MASGSIHNAATELYSPLCVNAKLMEKRDRGWLRAGASFDLIVDRDTGESWDFLRAEDRRRCWKKLRGDDPWAVIG